MPLSTKRAVNLQISDIKIYNRRLEKLLGVANFDNKLKFKKISTPSEEREPTEN